MPDAPGEIWREKRRGFRPVTNSKEKSGSNPQRPCQETNPSSFSKRHPPTDVAGCLFFRFPYAPQAACPQKSLQEGPYSLTPECRYPAGQIHNQKCRPPPLGEVEFAPDRQRAERTDDQQGGRAHCGPLKVHCLSITSSLSELKNRKTKSISPHFLLDRHTLLCYINNQIIGNLII